MPIDLDEFTQGAWIKGEDIGLGRQVKATISEVEVHTFEASKDRGLVISFEEEEWEERKLALNKTRARKCRELLGDNTDDWVGKSIALYATPVTFQGKEHLSVGIMEARAKKKAARALDDDEDVDVLFGKS